MKKGYRLKITTSQRERFIALAELIDNSIMASQNNYLSKREVYVFMSNNEDNFSTSLKITTSQRERFIR